MKMPMESPAKWHEFLNKVVSSDFQHYLWLRSLSYLEYIGYRKMVKAVHYESVNKGVFHHLSDEIRHSYLLKELAQKGFEGRFLHASFDQNFIDIAEEYFQDIDQEIKEWVMKITKSDRPYLCYLLASYIIEQRAMKVYPQYYARLEDSAPKMIIQKIIKDEKDHLAYLEETLNQIPELGSFKKSHLLDFEEGRFGHYLEQFQSCLPKSLEFKRPFH